jgi:hypothetical protein
MSITHTLYFTLNKETDKDKHVLFYKSYVILMANYLFNMEHFCKLNTSSVTLHIGLTQALYGIPKGVVQSVLILNEHCLFSSPVPFWTTLDPIFQIATLESPPRQLLRTSIHVLDA